MVETENLLRDSSLHLAWGPEKGAHDYRDDLYSLDLPSCASMGRIVIMRANVPRCISECSSIAINYVPNERVVELKAIKLYINSSRDRYISHEESVNQILDDFVAACDPLEATIKGDFAPRGNVYTVIEVHHQKPAMP